MPEAMDEAQLQSILKANLEASISYMGSEVSEDRSRLLDLYNGELLGNEIAGRSQVISSDVQDVVESIMPDLMQIFGASDKLAQFEPRGQEDEEAAKQATDYVNYIFNTDNEGFLILHDWIKDALIQINGVVKVWWEQRDTIERDEYQGLSAEDMTRISQESGVEIIEHTPRFSDKVQELIDKFKLKIKDPEQVIEALLAVGIPPETIQALAPIAVTHDFVIERKRDIRRCAVDNVPPEEFLISKQARDLESAGFLAHRIRTRTRSELIEMGYEEDQVDTIPTGPVDFSQEAIARNKREQEMPGHTGKQADKSTQIVDVFECYIKIDYDGDGVAELRKITAAGPQLEILRFSTDEKVPERLRGEEDNFQVTEHPFETITPIRMPHRVFGKCPAELAEEIQKIKTTLWRQVLDNGYNIINGRAAISNKVRLEDYLDNKVGAPIRVDTVVADVGGHFAPIATIPLGPSHLPILEYADIVRETRTGINRLGQGLDPDALNSTAGGINMLLGRSQQRVLMMAQVMANTGIKRLAKKILRTVIRHQDKKRVIRLREKWVDMDPRAWNSDMDVTVNVGLGHGTQQQQMVAMQTFMQLTREIVTLQQGANGPLIQWHHLRNQAEKFGEAIGLRSIDPFMAQVDEKQSQQIAQQAGQQPNPEMVKAQIEMQKVQIAAQTKMQEAKMVDDRERIKMGLDHTLELQKMGYDDAHARAQMDLDAVMKRAELQVKKETAITTAAVKAQQAQNKGNGKGERR